LFTKNVKIVELFIAISNILIKINQIFVSTTPKYSFAASASRFKPIIARSICIYWASLTKNQNQHVAIITKNHISEFHIIFSPMKAPENVLISSLLDSYVKPVEPQQALQSL